MYPKLTKWILGLVFRYSWCSWGRLLASIQACKHFFTSGAETEVPGGLSADLRLTLKSLKEPQAFLYIWGWNWGPWRALSRLEAYNEVSGEACKHFSTSRAETEVPGGLSADLRLTLKSLKKPISISAHLMLTLKSLEVYVSISKDLRLSLKSLESSGIASQKTWDWQSSFWRRMLVLYWPEAATYLSL